MKAWSLGLIFLLACSAASARAEFRAGAATSNITPSLGLNVVGGFSPSPSQMIHDELHARCLVLDDGEKRLAIVVLDLLGIARGVSDEARRMIEAELKIPRGQVLISATHTHSGSSAHGTAPELDEYQRFVARRIADGVHRASHNLRPAELAFGTVDIPEHVHNRRWFMKIGTVPENPFGTIDRVKMNPPAGSPNLTEPAGPTDPQVSILSLREPGGPFIAVWATYSLHYVGGVGPGHISADYYGMFCEGLSDRLGGRHQDPPFVALLSNGTSGDINNINFVTPRGRQPPYAQMRYVADDVADQVYSLIDGLKYRSDITLDAEYREPLIGWRHPNAEQIEWAKRTLAASAKLPEGRTDLPKIYAERTLKLLESPAQVPMPLQLLRIGEVSIGTMPNEVFCEIGLDFRRRSAIQPAFMVSLAHGYYGYLPTPRHFELGGYETWLGTNRLERDASDKMLRELLEMAEQVKQRSTAGR